MLRSGRPLIGEFVQSANIDRFLKLLKNSVDDVQRAQIRKLLCEEQAKPVKQIKSNSRPPGR